MWGFGLDLTDYEYNSVAGSHDCDESHGSNEGENSLNSYWTIISSRFCAAWRLLGSFILRFQTFECFLVI